MWYIAPDIIARKLLSEDAGQMFKSIEANRKYLRQWLPWLDDVGAIEDSIRFIQACIVGYQDNTSFILGLWSTQDNCYIGTFGFNKINNKHAEIGYWLAERYSGHGIMLKAHSWLLDYAFSEFDLTTVSLSVATENLRSQRTAIKLGFVRQQVLPENEWLYDHYVDHFYYLLHVDNWLVNDVPPKLLKCNKAVVKEYFDQVVVPYFMGCINAPVYSTLINLKHEIVMCTNQTARSIGLTDWRQAVGISYKHYASIDKARYHFSDLYNRETAESIHLYAKKIFRIQQYVFKYGMAASFIDSLPYANGIKSYLLTFTPVFHPSGAIVALQTTALDYRLFSYQEHIKHLIPKLTSTISNQSSFSTREHEVLFLLTVGATQEQIAQILNVKRTTVAAIIRNQLCSKFGISGSNTKLITQIALDNGILRQIPRSLWRPSVITLEDNLTSWINQRV